MPTRFIKFPRQEHHIDEPRLRRVRFVEEIRWMQKYVLGLEWTPWVRSVEDDAPARIAFHSDRDGNSEIYTIAPTGAGETRLTFNDDFDGFPSWSPDGESILFQSDREGRDAIFVMDPDGSNQRQLTFTDDCENSGAAFFRPPIGE